MNFKTLEAQITADSANWETCPRCKGSGQDPFGVDAECYEDVGGCDGVGEIRKGSAPTRCSGCGEADNSKGSHGVNRCYML